MEQWVEDEIVLPDGPFKGQRYCHDRHPVSRPWFRALDSGLWSRHAATGPTQNGKTLMCYVAPTLYHLFEIGETSIVGLPNMDMANDKWEQDILPVIEASRYAELLPKTGDGSRGGQVKRAVRFQNGATLRFLSGGGSDKKRAGFTSRVAAVTETDGMDEPGATSRESSKVMQIEARTGAFGRLGKRIYLECSVSIETGCIWQEVSNGTNSRLARKCPHCGAYVTPEREHLVGWQTATTEAEAAELATWCCPACGEVWSEDDRTRATESIVVVHAGQTVTPDGRITGEAPRTQTFGLRWSAIDNPFTSAADLGAEEWLARRSKDQANAELRMRQFIWCVPAEAPEVTMTPLDPDVLRERTSIFKRGVLPDDTIAIAIGVDTGKRQLFWDAKSVRPSGSMPVIEYGEQEVESDTLGVFRALVKAIKKLTDYFAAGWLTADGRRLYPSQVWIDSGYHEHQEAVYEVCRALNLKLGCREGKEIYRPTKGYGEGQRGTYRYRAPKQKSNEVIWIGRECYAGRVLKRGRKHRGVVLMHVNSDHWKSEVHQRLAMPADEPGAVTLYEVADPVEHATYVQHQVAEKQVETTKGIVFVREDRNNHYLDAGYLSVCAGYHTWIEWLEKQEAEKITGQIVTKAPSEDQPPTPVQTVPQPKRRKAQVTF